MDKLTFLAKYVISLILIFTIVLAQEIDDKSGYINSLNKISFETEPAGFASLDGGTTGGAGGDVSIQPGDGGDDVGGTAGAVGSVNIGTGVSEAPVFIGHIFLRRL